MDKTTVVIPARLGSTRLPRKVLADVHGHPLVWHVWKQVCLANKIDQVYIATDSEEVADIARVFGAQVLMTSPDCQSGTERIASLVDQLDADLILNVQGDEPFVDPSMLDGLITAWQDHPCDMITPVFPIHTLEELRNPNIVKVAIAFDGRALYFSRSPIPYLRDVPFEQWLEKGSFWGHIGVYGYQRALLENYNNLPASALEPQERLEQLRFLEAGYNIQTVETNYRPVAVDTLEDLEHVRHLMENNNG